jgi:NAD(P)-dependent dehydrogenase (short-subunit alcohol dehydrogenase family)
MIKNKVVVITGAFGKLGFNFVRFLLKEKAKVVLADIYFNEEKYKLLKGDFLFVKTDITSKDSILNLIKKSEEKFGGIDVLVNSAYPKGNNYGKGVLDIEYKDFCENINKHLGGYFLTSQQFAKYFLTQKKGNIINIASIYGFFLPDFKMYDGFNKSLPLEYSLIKASILQMTKYFAKYFKGKIKVNSISPGGILNNENQTKEWRERYASYAQTKGMLDREDLNGVLLFLISDMSNYINGQNIVIDDGFTL